MERKKGKLKTLSASSASVEFLSAKWDSALIMLNLDIISFSSVS